MNRQPDVYLRHRVALPDGPATLLRRLGVPEPGPATAALLQASARFVAGRVFVSGPGATATALWAARTGAAVTCWTEHLGEAQSLETTFRENALAAPRLYVQADFSGLEPETFDTVLLHLPRGRELQAEALRLAAALLRPGGWLAFVGAKQEGVRSALKDAQQLFGQAGVAAQKGGYHAGLAQRPPGRFELPHTAYTERLIDLEGQPTRLFSRPGVFAWERLDGGAAALIAGMVAPPGARVLDLGCGPGLVGLAALRRGAAVSLADVSAWAVEAARRTLAANGFPEAPVYHTFGAEALPDTSQDGVVTNPPFHKGHGVDFEVAQFFVAEAARVLRPGGSLYLVANAFLPYAPWLEAHFTRVTLAQETPRFRVWEGIKRG